MKLIKYFYFDLIVSQNITIESNVPNLEAPIPTQQATTDFKLEIRKDPLNHVYDTMVNIKDKLNSENTLHYIEILMSYLMEPVICLWIATTSWSDR